MENSTPSINFVSPQFFQIIWDGKNKGYGQIDIHIKEKGLIEIWNDNLTKEEISSILHEFVNQIVEKGKLMEYRND